ncbi:DUF6328 family protein [Pseudonocardia asaccharolytica]|uniref:DUF6328 family protein n=1 Tax=Pseudonocardia asaccharolytica TaxID=54010 RepID=UPI000429D63C|nr:DUF6328 family protein [Pseudonocardia asaccharolytica]
MNTAADHPGQDTDVDHYERDETEAERLDRNWTDLLQELRVVQTGVQLLTGLLLTVPFQQRFVEMSGYQRTVYLVALACSAGATALLIAPVSMHRILFRQRARRPLVAAGQWFALIGLAFLGLAVVLVMLLIFDVVLGFVPGLVAASVAFTIFVCLWGLGPWILRRRRRGRPAGSGRRASPGHDDGPQHHHQDEDHRQR